MSLRNFLKKLFFLPLRLLYGFHSRKARQIRFNGLKLSIAPGVFHPKLFFSTKYLVTHLAGHDLVGKRLMDVGTGSGAIAISAAKLGAQVTALDVNPAAVENAKDNAKQNGVSMAAVHSDLWQNVKPEAFDFIVINPPYYPKKPENDAQKAWYCGEGFEYFHRLFEKLDDYMATDAEVMMVLSQDCDFESIGKIAASHEFKMVETDQKRTAWEMNYIFNFIPEYAH